MSLWISKVKLNEFNDVFFFSIISGSKRIEHTYLKLLQTQALHRHET